MDMGDPTKTELHLATSAWENPELWQRPAVYEGKAVWIAENTEVTDISTGVYAVGLDGKDPVKVTSIDGILEAVTVQDGSIAWVGGGVLGTKPFSDVFED